MEQRDLYRSIVGHLLRTQTAPTGMLTSSSSVYSSVSLWQDPKSSPDLNWDRLGDRNSNRCQVDRKLSKPSQLAKQSIN